MAEVEKIEFTRPKMKRFQKAYDLAVKEGKETFTFDGHEWLTQYAKYVLEYLNDKINGTKN